jgi:chitin disaccharide deacetylase
MAGLSEKRLILCADDFGMSAGVNEGIIRAHRDGILTDTSLMVGGAAFSEATTLARDHPSLSVGLHLVLAQGRATAVPDRISSLVDADGMFSQDAVASGFQYFFMPGVRAQLRIEIGAQIEKFLVTGLPLSHLDGHMNVHMHPTVLGIILELAERYGIRAARLTREPLRPALRFDRRHAARKAREAAIFSLLSRFAERRLDQAGIRHPRWMFGLHQTGHVSEAYLLGLLPQLRAGVTEIYCHPGLWDAESRCWRPHDYEPEGELAALTSPRVRASVTSLGIELTTYHALARREL